MSYYEDERYSKRKSSARDRRKDDYDDSRYVDRETTKSTAVVKRRDDSSSSVDEEVSRDFPPGAVYRETTVRKERHGPVSKTKSSRDDRDDDDDDSYDDRYDEKSSSYSRRREDGYSSKRRSKRDDRDYRRSSRRYDSYSEDSSRSRSRTPPRKERRKSTTEQLLGAAGLGAVASALGKKALSRSGSRTPSGRERRKSTTAQLLSAAGLGTVASALVGKKDGRSRSSSSDRYRDRSRRARSTSSYRSRTTKRGKGGSKDQVAEAVKAALLAGVAEAVIARKEPGGWGGEKGKRVLTTAISAGAVDGILTHNSGDKDHNTRNLLGSALAGLATNRVINGPRSKSRGRGGDDSPDARGRSKSRGGLGDLAAGGVLAAAGKKLYDNIRSRSRGRDRSRTSSADSYDSRSPPRRRTRSQSVSAGLAKGLSAVGLSGAAAKVDPDRRKTKAKKDYYSDDDYSDDDDDDDGYDDRYRRQQQHRNGSYQEYRGSRDVGPLLSPNPEPGYEPGYHPCPPAHEGTARAVSASRALGPSYALDYKPHHTGDPETDSDSDLGSSTDEEKNIKQGRKKTLLTAGLATVATIHAAHNVYQSVEKKHARRQALREGDITEEQAKKMKNKNRLQDAASIGIAALGIKGAYSEWKETKEHNQEVREYREKMERHREKREARRRKAQLEAERYRQAGYAGTLPSFYVPTPPVDGRHQIQDVSHYPLQEQQQQQQHDPYAQGTHYIDDNPYSSYTPEPQHPSPQLPTQ